MKINIGRLWKGSKVLKLYPIHTMNITSRIGVFKLSKLGTWKIKACGELAAKLIERQVS